jgi:hypothetical protein
MKDVYKFNDFIKESQDSVIGFLSSLKIDSLPAMVNDFVRSKKEDRQEYIEDILLEIGDTIEGDKYNWVKKSLEEMNPEKNIKN